MGLHQRTRSPSLRRLSNHPNTIKQIHYRLAPVSWFDGLTTSGKRIRTHLGEAAGPAHLEHVEG